MNFSDILAIIGLLLSVVFGVWGIAVTVRKKYPGRISFVEENALGLFNSMVKNFPEIKIQYENSPISEQMVYLKASFINTGVSDLSTKELSQKLKISLKENIKWINCKLTGMSKDVICDLKIVNNELVFDFDLLKKNEFIRFDAFAEIKNSDKPRTSFRKAITFSHRIPNTAKVDRKNYLNEEEISDKRFEFKKNMIIASFIVIACLGTTFYQYFNKTSELKYKYKLQDKEYSVVVSSVGIDKIKLEDADQSFEKELTLQKFNSLKNLKAFCTQNTLWGYFKKSSIILLCVLIYLFSMFSEYRGIYKDRKIKSILDEDKSF